jgi:hypothetical protein
MMESANQILGCALALSVAAGKATAMRLVLPSLPAMTRHSRPHPPLDQQEPPGWLTTLARAVLLLALAALGLATLFGCADSST